MTSRPDDLTVRPLDATSSAEVESFWRVRNDAHRADHPHAVLEGLGALRELLTTPSEHYDRAWFVALSGGVIVGTAEMQFPLTDNVHTGVLDIAVSAAHRRCGVARALHEECVARARAAGRRMLLGEATASDTAGSAATAFAEAMGYRPAHLEHHLVLDLPVRAEVLAAHEVDAGYEIVTWTDACPPECRTAYIDMRNQMNVDVPRGDVDVEPVRLTEERLAASERLLSASYRVLASAALHSATGAFAGYSLVFLPHEDEELVWQDDTLVMPDHRGRRIGLALKRANLERIATQHPSRRILHTWTDPDNTAMYKTNERVGFRVAELMWEMELQLS